MDVTHHLFARRRDFYPRTFVSLETGGTGSRRRKSEKNVTGSCYTACTIDTANGTLLTSSRDVIDMGQHTSREGRRSSFRREGEQRSVDSALRLDNGCLGSFLTYELRKDYLFVGIRYLEGIMAIAHDRLSQMLATVVTQGSLHNVGLQNAHSAPKKGTRTSLVAEFPNR